MSISIVLADDHAMVRESLASYLSQTPDIRVLAAVSSAEDALHAAVAHQPNIVLLDIDMPGMEAFDAARRIRERCPATRVVILSAFVHDRYIERALAAGASGYLTKAEPMQAILGAVRDVAAGLACFSAEVRERLVITGDGVSMAGCPSTRAGQLSEREMEVLQYVARGLSNKEIATTMHLASRTVDHHVARTMRKLDIHGRVGLARYAVREGMAQA
jgi:DNA-binding NarL/FixJ family response regulator